MAPSQQALPHATQGWSQLEQAMNERWALGIRPGLERIESVLRAAGFSRKRLGKVVLVGGTNGKGSVCAMMDSMSRSLGLKTALYISPHLIHVSERIQFEGSPIPGDDLIQPMNRVFSLEKDLHLTLTGFEFVTCAGLLALEQKDPEVTVLEVGLGGRQDATNVVDADVCVLTPVGLDHTAILGPTLSLISREKLGILRQGVPLVTARQEPDVMAEVHLACQRLGSPLHTEDLDFSGSEVAGGFRYSSPGVPDHEASLSLPGAYQIQNAAVAIHALRLLLGDSLPTQRIREGLELARWPGRFDLRTLQDTPVLFDGAHNPPGIVALVRAMRMRYPGKHPVLFASKDDKDAETILNELGSVADELWVTGLPRVHGHTPDTLARWAPPGLAIHLVEDPRAALEEFVGTRPERLHLCCGSLYLVGYYLSLLATEFSADG